MATAKEICTAYIDAFQDAYCKHHEVCDPEREKCMCWKLIEGQCDIFGNEIVWTEVGER
jgi:hypothetical protein